MIAKLLVVLVAISSLSLSGEPPTKTKAAVSQSPTVESSVDKANVRLARLKLVAYRVTLPEDRIENLDKSALQSAASSKNGLKKHLAELGKVRIIGLVDHQIDLAAESKFQLGRSTPTVSGTQKYNGQTSTQVQYTDCGCIFEIRSLPENGPEDSATLKIKLDVSSIEDSAIQLAPNEYAPVYSKSVNSCSARFVFGKPEVFVTVDCGESSKNCNAMIYEFTIWPITNEDD